MRALERGATTLGVQVARSVQDRWRRMPAARRTKLQGLAANVREQALSPPKTVVEPATATADVTRARCTTCAPSWRASWSGSPAPTSAHHVVTASWPARRRQPTDRPENRDYGVDGGAMEAATLAFQDVTKRYAGQDEPAVDGLSLEVPAGEICVLVGPSGCGKTTAMRMVNRMIDITERRHPARRRAASATATPTTCGARSAT